MNPLYDNPCTHCIYLGMFVIYDIYACPGRAGKIDVVVRFGNKGHQQTVRPFYSTAQTHDAVWIEAYRRVNAWIKGKGALAC